MRRYFVDALPKDLDDPGATLPSQAITYKNKIFEIEKRLEVLSAGAETAFLEYPEILNDYLPWNEYVQKICR